MPNETRVKIVDVRAALAESAERLACALLGKPTQRQGSELRFFPKGGLVVHISGPRRGQWINWGSPDERGDMIDLICWSQDLDFKAGFAWAKRWLGISDGQALPPIKPRDPKEDEADRRRDENRRLKAARMIWSRSQPAEATTAAAYLASRGITATLDPNVIGWREIDEVSREKMNLPPSAKTGRYEALVVKAVDRKEQIRAVQQVILDGPAKAQVPHVKRTNGVLEGAAVRLGVADKDLILAEGPETGLSCWQATGVATWVALGGANFTRIELPESVKRLWIAVDIEASGAGLASALRSACFWRAKGLDVRLALPPEGDFNDLLQTSGEEAVVACFKQAVAPSQPHDPTAPTLICRQPADALALWRATGWPVRATNRDIRLDWDLKTFDGEPPKRVVVVVNPGETLTDVPDVEGVALSTLRMSRMTPEEFLEQAGPAALWRLVAMACPAGQAQIWGLEALAAKPRAVALLCFSAASVIAARRLLPGTAIVAVKTCPGQPRHLDPLRDRDLILASPSDGGSPIAAMTRELGGTCRRLRRMTWPNVTVDAEGKPRVRPAEEARDFPVLLEEGWTAKTTPALLDLAEEIPLSRSTAESPGPDSPEPEPPGAQQPESKPAGAKADRETAGAQKPTAPSQAA